MAIVSAVGMSAIATAIALFGDRPPVPAPTAVSTPTPVLIPPPSPTAAPSVAPSTQAESLEDARKREELAAVKVFGQIVIRNLKVKLTKQDVSVLTVRSERAWTNRAEWRELFITLPEESGAALASAIGDIGIAQGYYIQEDTSRAIQTAIRASVLEWWSGNYEREYITKNDPY